MCLLSFCCLTGSLFVCLFVNESIPTEITEWLWGRRTSKLIRDAKNGFIYVYKM